VYQQNGYQQQEQQPEVGFQEEDLAYFVLSELKRSAREYTTAALEAANPQVRQTFQTLVQKTLQDQAAVFQEIQKLGNYEIQPASQQQLSHEVQKQSQCAAKLHTFVQQNLNQASSTGGYQQQMMAQQQSQQHSQTQHQAMYQPPPTISSSAFPNAVYNQEFSQSLTNTHNQQQAYGGMQGQSYTERSGYQDHSYGQAQSYSAAGQTVSENAGLTGRTSSGTGMTVRRQYGGGKYSF